MEKRVRQLNISAEEIDKRTSAARRLNKKENNRLRQQYEQLDDNQEVMTIEIEQEMKKIQHELIGIREISGYEVYARTTEEQRVTDSDKNGRSKRKRRSRPNQRSSKANEKSRRRLGRQETLNGTNRVRFDTNGEPSGLSKSGNQNGLPRDSSTAPTKRMPQQIGATRRRISRSGLGKQEEKLPQIITSSVTDPRTSLELDSVSEAREQARKRLLGEQSENNESEEHERDSAKPKDNQEDDVGAYMYVPPDGRKRTVYLIPPLEDLLKEARKARYLRIPKRLLHDEQEDPERELSIDEIFNK